MSNTKPDSSQVKFIPAGAGAVVTTVQDKLRADDAGPTTVGDGTIDYSLASFYSNKDVTQHAWYDFLADGTMNFIGNVEPIVGHASYNDNKQIVGSQSFDHHHSFQAYPHYGCTGTLNRMSGYWSQPDVTAGTVTELSQFKASNALGAGTITKQYGFYSSTLTRGAENWAFFSAGTTPSFMGGAQYYGSGSDAVNAASIDYNPGTGYLRFIPRSTYGIEAVCKILKLGEAGVEAIFNNAADGNLYISARTGYATKLDNALAEGSIILTCYGASDGMALKSASGSGYSGIDAALYIAKNTVSNRSINAAGTVNASGADYAEYEKNNGLVIAKGALVGFKEDGTLTLSFADSVRFGIKSTDPSLVGGDTWGVGLEGDDLEVARKQVDRVAYSGKVPCNVIGAFPGGYIIAVDNAGAIAGEFVANPTFAQYKKAVGRVNRILPDGRCEVAVMVH